MAAPAYALVLFTVLESVAASRINPTAVLSKNSSPHSSSVLQRNTNGGASDQGHLADQQVSRHASSDLKLIDKKQNTSSLQVHVAGGEKTVSTHAAADLSTSEQDAKAQPSVDASALQQKHVAAEQQKVAQVEAHSVAKPEVVSLVQADQSHGAAQNSVPLGDVSQKETGFFKTGQTVVVGAVCVGVLLLFACVCAFMDHSTSRKKPRHGKRALSTDSNSSKSSKGSSTREQHTHDGHVIYEWDQTDAVATLYISVPPDVTKHDMQIKISSKRLQVGKVGRPAFLKEETCEEIIEQDSTWRLRSNGELQIYLHKARKGTWPCVFLHKREGD